MEVLYTINKGRTNELTIQEIPLSMAAEFVKKHHYSKVMPKLNKVVLGLFRKEELVGCITFGWGVRPVATIKCLFPSLDSKDYLEIGKLCLLDELPKNSESQFIAAAMKCIKKLKPELKLIFTWADALWGKPGYIYQAANFWYGGSIWTEVYIDKNQNRIHPRQLRKWLTANGESIGNGTEWATKNGKCGVSRPKPEQLVRLQLKQIFGMQFRYVFFLCDNKKQQELFCESTVGWHREYPKSKDMKWKIRDGINKTTFCPQPFFKSAFDTEKKCQNQQ